MAAPPLLTLGDIALTFGGNPLFEGLELSIHPGDRLALIGRNGSGKSTLLKLMAGRVEPDAGARFVKPGLRVAYLDQDPDFARYTTLGDFVREGLEPGEDYKAEMALDGVRLDPDTPAATASGGERRRAALAQLLSRQADLLLLDEPTNHLDIEMIGWLEGYLADAQTAFVLISHDRAFQRALTRGMLWLDRGRMRRLDQGFAGFEDWRDKVHEEEDRDRHKLDRLIKAEGRWAVEGISARRKRNMGRVRRLQEMRAERAAQIRRSDTAEMVLDSGPASGKRVVEARNISLTLGGRQIVRDFSFRIQRGDRVALVGPNGAGKTTLVNLLSGVQAPDSGTVVLGTNLTIARFDQTRALLDPGATLWDTLTLDPQMGVSGNSDQVMVRGRPRHVVGYLKDFLFTEAQARGPVRALSGGEKARLLLARIMAAESNLLVLDEPTNDLDVETLDLLQELLADYDGTALIVSHDRDFLDRVATVTLAVPGDGTVTTYAGGYTDMLAQRGGAPAPAQIAPKASVTPAKPKPKSAKAALGYKDQRRLDQLPAEIDRLGAEIAKLEALLSDPELYARDPDKFAKATLALSQRQAALDAAETEWLELEERREALS